MTRLFNRISLRMRIALLTGASILIVSLVLTTMSMYNANMRFTSISRAIEMIPISEAQNTDEITGTGIKGIQDQSSSAGLEAEINLSPASMRAIGTVSPSAMANYTILPDAIMPASTVAVTARREFGYWSYIYMFLIAGAGMAVSWYLAGKALNPVRRLSGAAVNISASNLSDRIPISETGDEIGELTEAFNGMLDRLEQSFERQRRFSSNVAHELKTPLATMKMSLQVGRMECGDVAVDEESGQKLYDIFTVAERSTDRLIGVVNDLLTLTSEGTLLLEDVIDLPHMLRDIVQTVTPAYAEKELDVNYNFKGDFTVSGDAGLVRRLFYNLIENAMKYSDDGDSLFLWAERAEADAEMGKEAEAGVETGCCGIRVSVADSGPGMEAEQLGRIFEPFYCVDPSRSRKLGGAGLGLSICQAIALRHGWNIHVESAAGEGSVFTVFIPEASQKDHLEELDEAE